MILKLFLLVGYINGVRTLRQVRCADVIQIELVKASPLSIVNGISDSLRKGRIWVLINESLDLVDLKDQALGLNHGLNRQVGWMLVHKQGMIQNVSISEILELEFMVAYSGVNFH